MVGVHVDPTNRTSRLRRVADYYLPALQQHPRQRLRRSRILVLNRQDPARLVAFSRFSLRSLTIYLISVHSYVYELHLHAWR